ncbi:MAG: hypothetical protein E4H41_01320 [Gemmatimonadales bacterium]|nr:MAG: hypothetical protein E4H41_01320 [Gemmatimonadales bacterium]
MPLRLWVLSAVMCSLAPSLAAQQWNSPEVLALVSRGAARRQQVEADTTLQSYRAEAHGFVLFLAQVGSGLTEPPRLVKADELQLEVYWRVPGISKQTILGWRDGTWLPTDINYHRDHLGVVTNNYGNRIRIGEGDEVRDVLHPLSPQGLAAYDFALEDSLALSANTRTVRVYKVAVRPKSFTQPLVIGTLYLDVETAEVVQFRFSFTPSAYLDAQLEDISIVLENALYEGRYWLPERQEIEIRRRTTWLDFPARGIIRGRWEVGGYTLNAEFPPPLYAAPPIGGLRKPAPDATAWPESLDDAVAAVAEPVNRQDMMALRQQVERIAGDRALSGLRGTRIASNAISELAHINRVQGLTLGFGMTFQAAERRVAVRPYAAYGTSDGRLFGRLVVEAGLGTTTLSLGAGRRVQDVSDFLITAPVVNSLTSQETGQDYGDYALVDWLSLGARRPLADRTALTLSVGVEESHDMAVAATPARGTYRPNPALGAGSYARGTVALTREATGMAARKDLSGQLLLEGGTGPTDYLRATAAIRWQTQLGAGGLRVLAYGGVGGDGMPAYRSFVMGGRGSLVGYSFREFGGRSLAVAHAEWRFQVPAPAIPLGSFANTGRTFVLAPFIGAGWSERAVAGTPWAASDGLRSTAGLATEWFMGLIRLEAGYGLRDGLFEVTVDVTREWWNIL